MRKTIKHAFSMFYTLIKHTRFLTNQSARRVLSIFSCKINLHLVDTSVKGALSRYFEAF